MERRNFLKFAVGGGAGAVAIAELGGVEAATMLLTGCNPPKWVTTVLNILNLVLPAVSGILSVAAAFTGIPVPPSVIAMVTTAVQTVINLVNQWINSPDPARPGILGDLQKAANLMQQDIMQILNTIHVYNTTLQAKIISAVNVVASLINALLALIPQATTASVAAPSATAFKNAYNGVMVIRTVPVAMMKAKLTPDEIQKLQAADAAALQNLLK